MTELLTDGFVQLNYLKERVRFQEVAEESQRLKQEKPAHLELLHLGNYLFGYFGQGFLMFDGPLLKYSAGAAQAWSDKDIAKWLKNMKAGKFGDNPNDAQYIEDGIKAYKKRKESK